MMFFLGLSPITIFFVGDCSLTFEMLLACSLFWFSLIDVHFVSLSFPGIWVINSFR